MTETTTRPKYPWEITRENRKAYEDILTEKWGGYGPALRDHFVSATPVRSQYRLGQLLRHAEMYNTGWQPLGDAALLIPLDARKALGQESYPRNINVTLMHPPLGGQSGGGNYNLLLLCEPYWYGDDPVYVTVEVGCQHDWETRNLGRCYNETKCKKCGAWYRVDSSD